MKKLVLLISSCFLTSLVTTTSASAQTVVHVDMSGLTFVGAGVCGGGNAACTETVDITFDWDVTSSSVVPGSISTASGAIGQPFSFANTGPVVGGQGFLWTDANGDSFSVNTCGFDCGRFPSVGSYNTIDVTLLCGSPGDTCFTDGFHGAHPTNGSFTISLGSVSACGSIGSSTFFSSNWAGYLLQGSSCAPVTAIIGSWIVANVPPSIPGTVQNTAQWVGVGGFRNFNDQNDLIQIGTAATQNQPGPLPLPLPLPPFYRAWYELITPSFAFPPVYVLAVNPGDTVQANVALSNAATNQWTLGISDLSTHKSFSTTVTFSSKQLSAEWILENACYKVGPLCGFPDFGTAYFGYDYTGALSSNIAIIGGHTVSLGTLPPLEFELQSNTIPLASPSPVSSDGTSFSVQWNNPSTQTVVSGSVTVAIQVGAASVQMNRTGTSVAISGSTAANGTAVTVNSTVLGTSQPPPTGTLNLGSAGFYDVSIYGIASGTAHVCITGGLLSVLSTMRYWNRSTSLWVSAANISVSNNFPSPTICGDIPVTALSGTPIAIGIPSAPDTGAHLVSALESITLNSATDEYVALVSVTNTGGDTAKGVTVTASKLNDLRTSTNLPISVGDISYAATVPVVLTFSARGSEEEDFGHLRIVETYTGGTAEQFLRVKLPSRGESERDDKDRETQDRNHPSDDH